MIQDVSCCEQMGKKTQECLAPQEEASMPQKNVLIYLSSVNVKIHNGKHTFYSSTDCNTLSLQDCLKVRWIVQNIKAEHSDLWLTLYKLAGQQAIRSSEAMHRLPLSLFPNYLILPSGWVRINLCKLSKILSISMERLTSWKAFWQRLRHAKRGRDFLHRLCSELTAPLMQFHMLCDELWVIYSCQ